MKLLKIMGCVLPLALLNAFGASAQEAYPRKPVKIIVAHAPGGGSDQLGRMMGQKLADSLKQPFIVENKPGAGGSIGTKEAARSPADGYTLLVGTSATHGSNPWLYDGIGYDAMADFVPITVMASTDYALAVPVDSGIRSLADLLKKGKDTELDYGSSGNGSTGHMAAAVMGYKAGIKTNHVPYKGAAAAMNDLIAGRFAFMFENTNVLAPFHKAGRLRIIAVSGQQRSQALPDVPTVSEAGVPGYSMLGWWALFAPAGTPAAVVQKLNAEANRILTSESVRNTLLANGNVPLALSSEDSRKYVNGQLDYFRKVIADSHIKLD
ncbi:MAG TPA: tripartite tricarboxylate transporter substrate binding protein [Ramlibacter sp.]|uniref:Bug family tripartite tricarboxylate transporter substrate binding protein n=1 Tax=Ramlibacter sp. TaxID=1917967 RepID=UPI002ED1ABB1